MKNASHKKTICEVLRKINDMHQGNTEHDRCIRKKLSEAEGMAKRMALKLLDYNKKEFAEWWEDNKSYEIDLRRRLNKNYCIDNKKSG